MPGLKMRRRTSGSYPQEQLTAIHPEENKPVRQQHGCSVQQLLQARAEKGEEVCAQVDSERIEDELFEQMRDQIRGNGVHAHHYEREGPFPIALHFDDPAKGGQEEEA